MFKKTVLTAALLLGTAHVALAQQNFDDWSVSSANGACWASTTPTSPVDGRGQPVLSIQNHPSEGVRGSIALTTGGIDASQAKAVIEVGDKEFATLTYGEAAFVGSGKPEAELTAAMQRGQELKISWTSKEGKVDTDIYSLRGFSAAKSEIDRNCR